MPNPISHFDIRADDVERARRFYERVFEWRFEAWGPPGFYMIYPEPPGVPQVHGALSKRTEPQRGGSTGFECTISVQDLAETRARITANGGKIRLDEHELAGVGRLVYFEDTEGNRACAMVYGPAR